MVLIAELNKGQFNQHFVKKNNSLIVCDRQSGRRGHEGQRPHMEVRLYLERIPFESCLRYIMVSFYRYSYGPNSGHSNTGNIQTPDFFMSRIQMASTIWNRTKLHAVFMLHVYCRITKNCHFTEHPTQNVVAKFLHLGPFINNCNTKLDNIWTTTTKKDNIWTPYLLSVMLPPFFGFYKCVTIVH